MPEWSWTLSAGPTAPAGSTRTTPGAIEPFASGIVKLVPPWLRRTVGRAILTALGAVVDSSVARLLAAALIRFPSVERPSALGAIGRERKLLRGPGETRAAYVTRLRAWWDAHRERGNAYSLLEQMRSYLGAVAPVVHEVVDYNGTRYTSHPDGTITRDRVLWGADASGHWARAWIMIHLDAPTIQAPVRDASGAVVLDGDGEPTLASASIFALSDADLEMLRAIPRAWVPAHVERTTIVLLYPGAELWGYRAPTDPASDQTIGTWADSDPAADQVWQPTDPVFIEV